MSATVSRTLTMWAPPDDVDTVHGLLEGVWRDAPGIHAEDRFSFEVAVIELASNVIKHADPGTGVSCTLAVEATSEHMVAVLSDTGVEGDIDLSVREMPDVLAESGRGLALVQRLVDELSYERDGDRNRWHIVRTLRHSPAA